MTYGYIRVSTAMQTCENQKLEIMKYCKRCGISEIDFYDETISGTRKVKDRKLGELLKRVTKGDVIIITELSRLGRSLMMILNVLQELLEKDVKVIAIKEGYELGDNIQSKVIAFAFGLSAEIERNLISERTKQGLARVKQEGRPLGHVKGQKNSHVKLTGKELYIIEQTDAGRSINSLAKELNVTWATLNRFIKQYC